jgi:hypothetical protein
LRGNLDLKDWVIEEKLHKNEKKMKKKIQNQVDSS